MLEYNLYDNFNPNVRERDYISTPSGNVLRGIPQPKARGILVDYEVWQTGYEFTSSSVFTMEVNVGDVVEVLTTENNPLAIENNLTLDKRLSFWYVITAVDENNKATMKNYFWAAIDGGAVPVTSLNGPVSAVFTSLMTNTSKQLMVYGYYTNWQQMNVTIRWNLKADTVEAPEMAKNIFAKIKTQPFAFTDDREQFGVSENRLYIGLVNDEWVRTTKEIRVDFQQNPTIEQETVVDRSNYNYVDVYVKNADTEKYPSSPKTYTINDSGGVVDLDNYTGDGTDLPGQRVVKTMFYDEQPTTAEIKAEITPDTVINKIYFNQNQLYPLQVNDLVKIWYNGTAYSGHIADRCFTQGVDRLLFVEGTS
ncbi:hypothetical protein [Lactococcus taiwanensis]|uniref:hypothetical protein n=1 Tax=Lactococcus taiwanensis TaxID=1151742 RepID=UPI001964238C|nr:hypothetical protein [Lactococcus taiwanensis]QRZ11723.1 hypothetical protein JVB21_03500 [Lactococcus taiwanensis]